MSIRFRKETRARQQYILDLIVIPAAERAFNIIGAQVGVLYHSISSRRKGGASNVKRSALQDEAVVGVSC